MAAGTQAGAMSLSYMGSTSQRATLQYRSSPKVRATVDGGIMFLFNREEHKYMMSYTCSIHGTRGLQCLDGGLGASDEVSLLPLGSEQHATGGPVLRPPV